MTDVAIRLDDSRNMKQRMMKQRDALLALMADLSGPCESLDRTIEHVLEVSSNTLDVERVSLWRYAPNRREIRCLDLFKRSTGRHSAGETLNASDFPNYFRVMAECDIVAVDDARSDWRTSEFTGRYLTPLNIFSMMDVPIHLNGEAVGILCHEQTGQPREWQEDEKAFALAVANLISLAFERCERSRAESTLALRSAALDAAADAIVITDANGVIVWVNAAFTLLTGYSAAEAIGSTPRELVHSGSQDESFYRHMWQTLTSGRVWRGEIVNRRKDGTRYHEDESITPVTTRGQTTHYIAIKRDITARHTLERQFLQAQKMEVIGRLAGGIAHDFNNVLTVINGTAEIALGDLAPGDLLREEFKQIQDAGARATALARRLMLFSRSDVDVTRSDKVVIAALLTDFRAMLQRLIGEDITLRMIAESGGAAVLGDAGQIEQVLLNLAINARDAMPRGGPLTIRSRDLGEQIELSVTDCGSGMSPEVRSRIFEPFFTTKDAGRGTGLGLATVDAIVRRHGGTVEVASQVGRGTTFTILLPAADRKQPADEAHAIAV